MVTNCIYRTSVFKNFLKKFKKISFHGHMGDYMFALITLKYSKKFLYYNLPLIIFRQWSENTHMQLHNLSTTMAEYKSWIYNFRKKHLSKMPFKEYVWSNCIASCLNETSKLLNLELSVNIDVYNKKILKDIIHLSNIKIKSLHLNKMKKEFDDYQKKNNLKIQSTNTFFEPLVIGNLEKKFHIEENNNYFLENYIEKIFYLPTISKSRIFFENQIYQRKKINF
jgi:hypothetical protein